MIAVPLVNRADAAPPEHEQVLVDPALLTRARLPRRSPARPRPNGWKRSPLLMCLIGIPGLVWLVLHFLGGGGLNLNVVNFLFLFLGSSCTARRAACWPPATRRCAAAPAS